MRTLSPAYTDEYRAYHRAYQRQRRAARAGTPTRDRVLDTLRAHGARTLVDLVYLLGEGYTEAAIAYHLRRLVADGLVRHVPPTAQQRRSMKTKPRIVYQAIPQPSYGSCHTGVIPGE